VRQGKERLGTSGEDSGLMIRWRWQGSFGWLWVVAEVRKTLLLEAKVFNIGEKELCGTKKG